MAHDQEDSWRLFAALNLRNDDVKELGSEDIVLHGRKATKNCDLPVNSLGAVDAVKSVFNIFYSYCFVILFLSTFYYLTKTSLTLYLVEVVVILDAFPHWWQVA